jgi:hypothetical protein
LDNRMPRKKRTAKEPLGPPTASTSKPLSAPASSGQASTSTTSTGTDEQKHDKGTLNGHDHGNDVSDMDARTIFIPLLKRQSDQLLLASELANSYNAHITDARSGVVPLMFSRGARQIAERYPDLFVYASSGETCVIGLITEDVPKSVIQSRANELSSALVLASTNDDDDLKDTSHPTDDYSSNYDGEEPDHNDNGFEQGSNAKQRKKLLARTQPTATVAAEESKASSVTPHYRPTSTEMGKIKELWVKLLKASPTRTLPAISLCEVTNDKLGIPITNDSVADIVPRFANELVYGGYGEVRVIAWIDASGYKSLSAAAGAAKSCTHEQSRKMTTRSQAREAADLIASIIKREGPQMIDDIGDRIRELLPESPFISRVLALYRHDRFLVHADRIQLRAVPIQPALPMVAPPASVSALKLMASSASPSTKSATASTTTTDRKDGDLRGVPVLARSMPSSSSSVSSSTSCPRPTTKEMDIIVALWAHLLTMVPKRTLLSSALCQVTKEKLGISLTNGSIIVDIVEQYAKDFVVDGFGALRVVKLIDHNTETIKEAHWNAVGESKDMTTREDARDAAELIEKLLKDGPQLYDDICDRVRAKMPNAPFVERVIQLYRHDRFWLETTPGERPWISNRRAGESKKPSTLAPPR